MPKKIGNDSLLLATRQIIYTRYCRLQDTAHARMLLDRMKPYAIRIKDKHLLMNHLRMAFLHAQTRQPAECERWINEARKYAYINPQTGISRRLTLVLNVDYIPKHSSMRIQLGELEI